MTRAAADLMASMKALTEEVEAETGLLRRGEFAELDAAVARKQQAAARYEAALKTFASEAKAAISLPERLRRDLRAAARKLEIVLSDNSRLVAANREASTRLIGRIIEAASQNPAAGRHLAAQLLIEQGPVGLLREAAAERPLGVEAGIHLRHHLPEEHGLEVLRGLVGAAVAVDGAR